MSLYPLHAVSPEHPRIRGHELPHQREELIADAAARLAGTRVDVWTIATDFGSEVSRSGIHTWGARMQADDPCPATAHHWAVIDSQQIPVLK